MGSQWENISIIWATAREGAIQMRKKNYKGRCEKRTLSKCKGVFRSYDILQTKYADILAEDPEVSEIRCNVLMEGLDIGEYTSDFVCTRTDGTVFVRECTYRKNLTRAQTMKLLDSSQRYWHSLGIHDWKLVIDAKHDN